MKFGLPRLRAFVEALYERIDALGDDEEEALPSSSSGRSRLRRNITTQLALGLSLALFLHLVPDFRWLATKQDQAMDWMVRMHSGVSPASYQGAPFLWLDVDEAAYREWGEPFVVPRAHLHALLDYAVGAGSPVILVNLDLSRSDGEQDRILVDFLEDFANSPLQDTHIVFARSFRDPWPPDPDALREQRESFLDPIVAASPHLHWSSTLFIRESDRLIRRFRNFETTCTDGVPGVVPAMQLLATALYLEGDTGRRKLASYMEGHQPTNCGDVQARSVEEPADRVANFADLEIALAADRLSSRILFNVPWVGPVQGAPSPSIPFEDRRVPLLTRIPAGLVTKAKTPLAKGLARGRIAVIGASHSESRDFHMTPLGEMPGALIVTNATYSLLRHGGLKPPSIPVLLLAQATLIVLVSLVFSPLNFHWATVLAAPLVVLVMLPLSFWLFQYGVWLDFAIPLGAVQFQVLVKKYMERYAELRSRLRELKVREHGASTEMADDEATDVPNEDEIGTAETSPQ